MDAPGAWGDRRRRSWDLRADERGATAIEYALIAAIVAISAITGLRVFGTESGALYAILDQLNVAILAVLSG
jgi:Flp pilus assembly pilin Flp